MHCNSFILFFLWEVNVFTLDSNEHYFLSLNRALLQDSHSLRLSAQQWTAQQQMKDSLTSLIHDAVGTNWNIGSLSGFLWSHIKLDTLCDSSGRVISPSQRPLPTQDKTTYKHEKTSMPRSGFEPATPATKRPQTARPLRSAVQSYANA
jgi:hypothetical protein